MSEEEEPPRPQSVDTPKPQSTSDGEYEPYDFRPEGPLTSDFAAFMHLLKSAIGSGILFLPHACRRAGYVMAIIGGIVIGVIATYTACSLVRCSYKICKKNRLPSLDFAKTAEMSFEMGPPALQRHARKFNVYTNVLICFVQLQACVIYILYGATSFQQVIEFFADTELSVHIYIVAIFPIVVVLAMVPNLKYLAPFSVVGALFLFVGLIITMCYVLTDIPDPARLDAFTDVLSVPMYCSIFLFALHNMTLYLPLQNSMEKPAHMNPLIIISMVLNISIYLAFGLLGYNKYMTACDTVIKNLPLDDTLAQVVKITIALSVLFTYGIAFYVPITIFWPMIKEKKPDAGKGYEFLLRFGGAVATALIAISVPQMIPLLGFLAAFSMTNMMLLIPVAIEVATYWNEATPFLYMKNAVIFVIGLLVLIFGAGNSLWNIIKEYGGKKEEGC